MKNPLAAWALGLFLSLAACQAKSTHEPTKNAGYESAAATVSTGPCDIRPLPKLSDEIYVADSNTIKYLGEIKTDRATFHIYYYNLVTPENNHENNRLIVFDWNCKYLGLYVTDVSPVRIERNKVIYHTQYPGNVVTFTGDKPPDHIWIDGDLPALDRPDHPLR
jgi:hypothetical protein